MANEDTARLLLQLVQSMQSPATTAAATAASPSTSASSVASEHRMLFGRRSRNVRRPVATPSDDTGSRSDDNSECVGHCCI